MDSFHGILNFARWAIVAPVLSADTLDHQDFNKHAGRPAYDSACHLCIYICIYIYIQLYVCIYIYIYVYTSAHVHGPQKKNTSATKGQAIP